MGTSAAYSPSPRWGAVKGEVTHLLGQGPVDGDGAHGVVSHFVDELTSQGDQALGNLPTGFGHITAEQATEQLQALLAKYPKVAYTSSGGGGETSASESSGTGASRPRTRTNTGPRGGGGKGGAVRSSSGGGVRPLAQRLATFISEVPKIGLREALQNIGIAVPDEFSPENLALAVADVLVGDASLIIEAEMREALINVLEELCPATQTMDQAEQSIAQSAGNLENVLQLLFENYIMERFKTFFCEHEAPKHGNEAADKILNEAREFVSAELSLEQADRHDLTSVNWTGQEGATIVDAILERTIAVYTD